MVANVNMPSGKKNNKNQYFSTFDVLSVMFSLVVVVSISFTVFHKTMNRKKVDLAKFNMENLAQELMKEPVIYSQDKNLRMPASASDLGVDPWGSPYVFNVIKNNYGQPIYLVVMSPGPNAKLETNLESDAQIGVSHIENIRFESDDVGYVRSFR